MAKFIIKYLIVGVVGTFVVYFGAPRLATAFYSQPSVSSTTPAVIKVKPQKPATALKVSMREAETMSKTTAVADKEPMPEQDTESNPATNVENKSETPTDTATREDERWGVVKTPNTSVFDDTGRFLRSLQPGIIVEIKGSRPSKTEKILSCNIEYGGEIISNVLLRASSLQLREGTIDKATDDEKKLMSRVGSLIAELENLKKKELAVKKQSNPYTDEYNKIREKHTKYWSKVKELTKKRDQASGEQQMEYSDELRSMKGEDIIIGNELAEAKKKYTEWASQNPISTNPKISQLETELENAVLMLRQISFNK